ncbi:MAG: RNA-binding domain-containing protein [Anaerolineales bacterium]
MDLHLHTPASIDYQEPNVTYLDILQRAEQRGLDIIAFTDHNTVGGIRRMKDEIRELEFLERLARILPEEQRRLNEYRRLTQKILVLPGFEFTATLGFHIIGLFPPDTPGRELEHLLLSLHVPPDQIDLGSDKVGATSDVLTAYGLIAEAGGLAIAAHANSSNGVAMRGLSFGGQTRIAYTQDPQLAALEVTDLDRKGRATTKGFFNGSKPEYPRRMHIIQGSDAHRLRRDPANSKNLGVGDRTTDVLLDEVSFEALKELFASNDFARTRPHTGGVAEVEFDYVQQAREEGANIVQDFHESMQARSGKLAAIIADVCAFANTNGGTLYIGVSADAKQPLAGVPDPKKAVEEIKSAIDRMITPRIECTVDTQETKGKAVLRILVPRGDDPPYAIEDNKIFVRDEAETSLAVRDEIVQLVLRRSPVAISQPAAADSLSAQLMLRSDATRLAEALSVSPPAEASAASVEEAVASILSHDPPRTGVEIVSTEERNGRKFHTMRDLRNGNMVKNVTLQSARKLWHYALTEHEHHRVDPRKLHWQGDLALVKKSQKGGVTRYDLAQRANGDVRGDIRVYYGVTEDGIHGAWRQVVGQEE